MAEWFRAQGFNSVAPGSNTALATSSSAMLVPSWSASSQLGFLLVMFNLLFLSRYLFCIHGPTSLWL